MHGKAGSKNTLQKQDGVMQHMLNGTEKVDLLDGALN